MSYLNITAQAAGPSKWSHWPFNSGTGGDWETSLATYAFSAFILLVISLFLRKLYGPGGIWRDKDMEREAEEAKRRAHAELDADFRAGRLNETQYKMKKKVLDR